jgi:class 3 adenylate cyclase/tetratricopeptide (TPR) repeat protein
MRCTNCQTENGDTAKFCTECASPLARACASCGAANPPSAKFCANCGTSLSGVAKPPTPRGAEGERRHLTVLFCDLVNSTEIAAQLDLEQYHAIAADYQRMAADAITKAGGHVAKYLGDGLVVYFGYPQAQEDAAERAVRAGLAIVAGMAALNARFAEAHHVKLSVRVGIHSGHVVVAQGGGNEADMFGDAPNIASRVQTAAAPDTVVITAATLTLVSGLFPVEDLGAHKLKGIDRPVHLYRAVSAGIASGRGRGFISREPAPFVGREDETHLLMSRWRRVLNGEGQFVLVTGEPGIGKSRLVEHFHANVKEARHLWIECGGAPFFANAPFYALTQMATQRLGTRGEDNAGERFAQLERALEPAGLKLAEAVPLIAEMLNLPPSERYPMPLYAADQRRRRLLATLSEWAFSATRNQPVVLVMEDLHWVDPSSLEFLQMLAEQGGACPLLLLCTARPEFRPSWPMRAHHAQITLNRLNNAETRDLVKGIAAKAGLTQLVVDTVIRRTDGVPLFAEELTRLILEGAGAADIPATLLDSLTARLDRLGPAKEVAQLGAVLGREFSFDLLAAVAGKPPAELESALAKLADAELLYVRGVPPEATYQFKHALIQDAAYQALLKTRRRDLHAHVARTITEKFQTVAQTQPQILARHWSEAGDAENAFNAWLAAAHAANARSAFVEAADAFRRARTTLLTLPETPDRDHQELTLGSTFASVLHTLEGSASAEAIELFARNDVLAERSGNMVRVLSDRFNIFVQAFMQANWGHAAALAVQLSALSDRAAQGNDPKASNLGVRLSEYSQFIVNYYRGNFIRAEEHFLRWDAAPAAGKERNRVSPCYAQASNCAYYLGRADLGRERARKAIEHAREHQDLWDASFALLADSQYFFTDRDVCRAEAAATEVLAMAKEYGLAQMEGYALVNIGWVRALSSQAAEGLSLINQGIAILTKVGSRATMTSMLTMRGEAEQLNGATDAAFASFQEALEFNPDELLYQPHALAARGDLHLKLGQHKEAEDDYRAILAQALPNGNKAYELRATLGLCRVRPSDSARREKLAMLCAELTPAFDTVSLATAKAFLGETPR